MDGLAVVSWLVAMLECERASTAQMLGHTWATPEQLAARAQYLAEAQRKVIALGEQRLLRIIERADEALKTIGTEV